MRFSNTEIINQIKKTNDWIDATELSNLFNVSTRTIRKRISDINLSEKVIESSYRGYRYIGTTNNNYESASEKDGQILYILRKLISNDSKISIYDLADEMYVSDSQFARILEDVRNYLEQFDIELQRYRNLIFLEKNEIKIRKLLKSIIKNSENEFLISNEIDSIVGDIDVHILKKKLNSIFENHNIYINDYGYNSILIHVIVMINRYRSSDIIDDVTTKVDNSIFDSISIEIKRLLSMEYYVSITNYDVKNLSILIANNCNNIDLKPKTMSIANDYIDEKYIVLTSDVLHKLADNYCLEKFDETLIINLALHIRNLVERAKIKSYTPNPLAKKFKEQNALIYDMAIYVASEIQKEEKIIIVDDEIAFIAFHIGHYIENSMNMNSKINCCFVFADYHKMYINSIDKIMNQLQHKVNMTAIISIRDIDKLPTNINLIISTVGTIVSHNIPTIEASVFISENDMANISKKVDEIIRKEKNEYIINNLQHFLNKSLFKMEMYAENEFLMIEKMSNDCFTQHLIDSEFVNEVIERERLSSTSFPNYVAIPHSLNANARKSFLYIVLNKKQMKWGNFNVNLIVLFGVCKKDKRTFTKIFGEIINILSDKNNVRKLTKCEDFDCFVDVLFKLINDYKD